MPLLGSAVDSVDLDLTLGPIIGWHVCDKETRGRQEQRRQWKLSQGARQTEHGNGTEETRDTKGGLDDAS